jgi:predicted GH43/DUF377 family glycosyl hydrolase
VTGAGVLAVRRSTDHLAPDRARVITRLFVPGQEGFDHQESRTAAVVARLLALNDDEVDAALDLVTESFRGRHRDLDATFDAHAAAVADRLEPDRELSQARRRLLGATFTSEYAVEGAALCNPCLVAHPDQSDLPAGTLRFVMSVRAVGEGHRSTIGFRTGTIDNNGDVALDPPPRFTVAAPARSVPMEASIFRSELHRLDRDGENTDYVFHALDEQFSIDELNARLDDLQRNLTTRRHAERTIDLIRGIAERTYGIEFEADIPLAERILWPAMRAESHGMEDARFVPFTHDDGHITYYATYTAYDGSHISQQLLETTDFRVFTSSPLIGDAAANKGLALFPRRVGGRFAALSRSDRESNSVAFSDDLRHWPSAYPTQLPTRAWELLQLGNCGSPVETDAGWLVLTHGVGPMRTYSIGAILLDLDDPTVVLSQLRQPLLTPRADEQNGYVPNVVYSCGALVHADTLVLPYGIGDAAIGVATVAMPELLAELDRSRDG